MDIKKVLVRKSDGAKYVIIPKKSDISPGEYVKIIKIAVEEEDHRTN